MGIALFFLAIFSSLGIGLFLLSKGINFFQAPILTISFIIFILYLFGLFNILQYGIFSIYILGIFLFVRYINWNLREFRKINFSGRDLLIAIYAVPFITAYWAIDSSYLLTNWDEFSIWGPNIKYMHLFNQLYSFSDLSYMDYKNYPPAQEIYQYFYIYSNKFSERKLIFLEVVIVLLTLASIFYSKNKNFLYGGLGFLTSTTVIFYFHINFNTIYVDVLLAFYFASTIFFIIQARNKLIDQLCIFLMLFILVQIKSVGLFMSCIALLIYFIVVIASNLSIKRSFISLRRPGCFFAGSSIRDKILPYSYLVFSIFAVAFSFISWSIFSASLGVNIYPARPSLIQFFEPPLSDKFITITHALLIRLQESSFTFHLRFHFLILTLFISGLLIPIIFSKHKKIRNTFIFFIFGTGFIGYLFFLLYLYVVRFSEYEGIQLAGFERYSATYLIAWVLILLAYITIDIEKKVILRIFLIACFSAVFIFPPPYFYNSITKFSPGVNEFEVRLRINKLLVSIKDIPVKEKIFYISQNSSGFDTRVFQYSILPRETSKGCGSLGIPYNSNDTYTCNQRLEDLLGGYNFIAIYNADEQFWKNNGHLFDKNSRDFLYGVFQVERNNNKILIKRLEI